MLQQTLLNYLCPQLHSYQMHSLLLSMQVLYIHAYIEEHLHLIPIHKQVKKLLIHHAYKNSINHHRLLLQYCYKTNPIFQTLLIHLLLFLSLPPSTYALGSHLIIIPKPSYFVDELALYLNQCAYLPVPLHSFLQ